MMDCLIVDDENELAAATCEYFEMFGVSAAYVTNTADCFSYLEKTKVKLLLLDINLDNESGFVLCKAIREYSNIPILFISARQSDDDILIGLNIGGDDYIKKPYSLSILLAKVKIVLKRYEETKKPDPTTTTEGRIQIDYQAMIVIVDGKSIILKNKEFKLFTYLFENRNKVITKSELFCNVWGDAFFSDGTLNVHIRKIREKVEENPNEPKVIKTIWGTGYMMKV